MLPEMLRFEELKSKKYRKSPLRHVSDHLLSVGQKQFPSHLQIDNLSSCQNTHS